MRESLDPSAARISESLLASKGQSIASKPQQSVPSEPNSFLFHKIPSLSENALKALKTLSPVKEGSTLQLSTSPDDRGSDASVSYPKRMFLQMTLETMPTTPVGSEQKENLPAFRMLDPPKSLPSPSTQKPCPRSSNLFRSPEKSSRSAKTLFKEIKGSPISRLKGSPASVGRFFKEAGEKVPETPSLESYSKFTVGIKKFSQSPGSRPLLFK